MLCTYETMSDIDQMDMGNMTKAKEAPGAADLAIGIVLTLFGAITLALSMTIQRYALAHPSPTIPYCGLQIKKGRVWGFGLLLYLFANVFKARNHRQKPPRAARACTMLMRAHCPPPHATPIQTHHLRRPRPPAGHHAVPRPSPRPLPAAGGRPHVWSDDGTLLGLHDATPTLTLALTPALTLTPTPALPLPLPLALTLPRSSRRYSSST